MVRLENQLDLPRCPHCGVDKPSLNQVMNCKTNDYKGGFERIWKAYSCARCGGVVMGYCFGSSSEARELYPPPFEVEEVLPERAREYLSQAIDSMSAPSGAVMLAASAVDAMLKAKNYKDGSLYSRIDKAAKENEITSEMAAWAHEVRLGANEQRHADENVPLPNFEDAKRVIEFTKALATFMFVLPSRVRSGLEEARKNE